MASRFLITLQHTHAQTSHLSRKLMKKECRLLHFFILALSSSLLGASCPTQTITIPGDRSFTRAELVGYLSDQLHTSVLAEFINRDSTTAQRLTSLPRAANLMRVDSLFNAPEAQCVLSDGVIHLYQPLAITAKRNALNHVFAKFTVPSSADLFLLELRNRLHREVFNPNPAESMSGPGGGAYRIDGERFPLKREDLISVAARDVFFHEARQQPMNLSIEVPVRMSASAPIKVMKALTMSEESMRMDISQ